jgi:IS5 family transposase
MDEATQHLRDSRSGRDAAFRCPLNVSDAALHDSQAVDHLLMRGNTGAGVRADPDCRSEEMEARLRARGLKSRIYRKGKRGPSR